MTLSKIPRRGFLGCVSQKTQSLQFLILDCEELSLLIVLIKNSTSPRKIAKRLPKYWYDTEPFQWFLELSTVLGKTSESTKIQHIVHETSGGCHNKT
jgi:hypothetical protein